MHPWPQQSEIFRTYVLILAGVLAGAGIVLGILTWGLRKKTRSIWITYRSWLVMVPLGLAAVFLGRIATILLFVILSLLAFNEFARATGLYKDRWMTGMLYLAIVALGISAILPNASTHQPGCFALFMSMPVYATAIILLMPILRNRTQGQLQIMVMGLFGFTCIGWMFLHLAFLADRPETFGCLLYLVFAVQLNDVAAFTVGRMFSRLGKHKLRSNISPKKTWEGALGALALSMALPWMMRFSFPRFGPVQLILTGLIIGIGGQLGDLAISVIKRELGRKDMGASIPGHGGVLDRIDSLIYTAPLFVHMINFFFGYW